MNKINWENLPSQATPINAENLNQMQTNIENAINSFTTTTDTNGWTVLNFGHYKEYVKKIFISKVIEGNQWGETPISYIPAGLSTLGNRILTASAKCRDNAISVNICCEDNWSQILMGYRNAYSGEVQAQIYVILRILDYNV